MKRASAPAARPRDPSRAGGRILIACEYSGRVRDAFRALGHDAVSCDLLPSEAPGPHIQGDVTDLLREPWDLVIAHPPCTYLANSGVRWRVERREWEQVREAAEFFLCCYHANAPMVAVENPVMHSYGREAIGGIRHSFTIQPWQFGNPYKKRTCFWTRGLPPLTPTSDMTADDAEAACHKAPPSPDRWKDRSRTYPGIAQAIAEQWGALLNPAEARVTASRSLSDAAHSSRAATSPAGLAGQRPAGIFSGGEA